MGKVTQLRRKRKVRKLSLSCGCVDVERVIDPAVGLRGPLHPQSAHLLVLFKTRRVNALLEQDLQGDQTRAPGAQHGDAGPSLGG